MIISNFRDYGTSSDGRFIYATVDVTEGALWWKRTVAKRVARPAGRNGEMRWLDTATGESLCDITLWAHEQNYMRQQAAPRILDEMLTNDPMRVEKP